MTPEEQALTAWSIVEADLRRVAPTLVEQLPPGATIETVRRAEEELGVALPDTALAVFLVRDGLGVRAVAGSAARTSYLLSLSDAVRQWRELTHLMESGRFSDFTIRTTLGPVKADWWNRGWLPISTDGAGNHFCIDLDPEIGGRRGQIIEFFNDDDVRAVVAPDLPSYLLAHVDVAEWARREGLAHEP
jgi:cell wall assembly regulator SMI1